jgi:hypothetical protein
MHRLFDMLPKRTHGDLLIHSGSLLVTLANTVRIPVKTGRFLFVQLCLINHPSKLASRVASGHGFPIRLRHDAAGLGPWSLKDGVTYVTHLFC